LKRVRREREGGNRERSGGKIERERSGDKRRKGDFSD